MPVVVNEFQAINNLRNNGVLSCYEKTILLCPSIQMVSCV